MGLIIAGIDEAGYGPLLGPMSVGLAVVRIAAWTPGAATPDVWSALSTVVCKTAGDAAASRGGRIAVADSKELKLANPRPTPSSSAAGVVGAASVGGQGKNSRVEKRHPAMHLERGVLAFLAASGASCAAPADDDALIAALGAQWPGHECYRGPGIGLPIGWNASQAAIAASMLRGGLERAGIEVLLVRGMMIAEERFNRIVRAAGSKASVSATALGEFLRELWTRWGAGEDALWVVCDRLGGRSDYAEMLRACIVPVSPGVKVDVVEESGRRSRYALEAAGDGAAGVKSHRMGVTFLTEGEAAHLPVALASMTAKYLRELAMERFNRWWCARFVQSQGVELKPTAGYREDGNRWLKDAMPVLTADDREALVRIA
jgi:hypothetical protein